VVRLAKYQSNTCEHWRIEYNYFRTYDPSTGRYLESDPIGLQGGLNTYGYAYQNPLSYTDVLGLAVEACGDDEDCIQKCLDEYYGSAIDKALAASPFSFISLGLNEAAAWAEDELSRQANRNRYTGARNSALGGKHGYVTGRRQARLLSVFRRFNSVAAVTGAGAGGFLLGAYGNCAVRCAFK
jgi:RHS repeat-associated protein